MLESASRIHNFIINECLLYRIIYNICCIHATQLCVHVRISKTISGTDHGIKLILPASALVSVPQKAMRDKNDDQCLHTISICICTEEKKEHERVCV